MREDKRTFPNFHLAFLISMNSNSFHHKTLEWRWYDFFHLNKWKGFLKIFEFHLEIFSNSETLCNSLSFMREDKMSSSNAKKESWTFQRIKLKVPLKLFWKPTFNLELFGFYSNYFYPKIKYMENRVKWFPTAEKWREMSLNSFLYSKIFLFGF